MKTQHIELKDITAEKDDNVEIEIQPRENGFVLYIHVDGITVLRICKIKEYRFVSEIGISTEGIHHS